MSCSSPYTLCCLTQLLVQETAPKMMPTSTAGVHVLSKLETSFVQGCVVTKKALVEILHIGTHG